MNKKASSVNSTTGRYTAEVEPDYDDLSPELAEALRPARGGSSNATATTGQGGGNIGIIDVIFGPNRSDVKDDLLRQAMELARQGKNRELKAFLKQYDGKFNINGTDSQGRNLAHYAAMSGDIKTLHAVKRAGVDMTATDNNGNTIAHTACRCNGIFDTDAPKVGFIKTIERYGVDVTEPNNNGETPLDIIAPVNEEGKRVVPGVVKHGIFGEGIDENGRRCPVTIYGPNKPAEATAQYLAQKEGDNRQIVSDTRNSLERNRNREAFPREQFYNSFGKNENNPTNLTGILNNLGEPIKDTEQVATNDDIVNDAFKAMQRGSNNEL